MYTIFFVVVDQVRSTFTVLFLYNRISSRGGGGFQRCWASHTCAVDGQKKRHTRAGEEADKINPKFVSINPSRVPLSFSHLKRKAIIHTQTNARTGEEEKIRRNGFLLKISKKKSCYFDTTIQSSFLSCWKLGNESVLLYF